MDASSSRPPSPLVQRVWLALDWLVIAALVFGYYASFELTSEVNGPYELFQADGIYIIGGLGRQEPYPFYPQNHLLYHVLVENGYAFWSGLVGRSADSVYGFLKGFTALTALGFLLGFRLLLRDMGHAAPARALLLLFLGVSVSAWFNFAAFETRSLAMIPVVFCLVAVFRLASDATPRAGTHALLISSLILCGLARTEGWRLTALVLLLPLLPAYRRHARSLLRDVVVVGALGLTLTAGLASFYFSIPWSEVAARLTEGRNTPSEASLFGTFENVTPAHLATMARAVGVYAFAMPVRADNPDDITIRRKPRVGDPGVYGRAVPFFSTPIASVAGDPLALVTMATLIGFLLLSVWNGAPRLRSLEPFPVAIVALWLSSWVFFTWWNPHSPFLWTFDFLPLTVALIALSLEAKSRWVWGWLLAAVALLLVHNTRFFYLEFR